MKSAYIAVLLTLPLCSCSLIAFKHYDFPLNGEESPIVRFNAASKTDVFVNTIREDGCVVSRTKLPKNANDSTAHVHPDKEIVITYVVEPSEKNVCVIHFSFVPRRGSTYDFYPGAYKEPKGSGIKGILASEKNFCTLYAIRTSEGGGSYQEPLRRLELVMPFFGTCMKVEEK
jgi:hypothetical protein